jgi:ligand-binding sensor domain-containing protein
MNTDNHYILASFLDSPGKLGYISGFGYLLMIILFSITVFVSALPAQTQNIQFKSITTEQELSQNTVHSIIKDSQGYMWFGTQDGLNRYNGYECIVFRPIRDDSTFLSNTCLTFHGTILSFKLH